MKIQLHVESTKTKNKLQEYERWTAEARAYVKHAGVEPPKSVTWDTWDDWEIQVRILLALLGEV